MAEERLLNEEQKRAVEHGEGPLLIIAGAGTGKTTVITQRVKHLILERNVNPSHILALTFTEKAATEMEERIDVVLPYGYTQMWISTFHAFCDRVLRNEAIHIGLTTSYKLATEAEIMLFLRQNIFKFQLDYFRPLGNPNKFLSGMIQHFSRLKDEDISVEEYFRYAKKRDAKRYTQDANRQEAAKVIELANAFKTYEDLKVKEGIMDFADLIANTLKLFRERKNILKQYQDQFKYVLVDEFQDTNYAQNTLAILLAGTHRNITVVGDDDQAIYRWRGAAIANMIQFRKQFPDTTIVTLTKNYRSTEEILEKAYRLIQHNNPDRLEVKEKINKKLEAMQSRPNRHDSVTFLFADRVEDEAELVVKKIEQLINKQYRYQDVAILVRANDYSHPFVRSLGRHNIPYQFLGPGRLFHQEEIKDLIAYLKVLYNFEDATSLYRVLNMPTFQLHARDIAALLNLARKKNISLFEAMERIVSGTEEVFLQEHTKEKVHTITEMIKRHLAQVPKDTTGQILYYFLEDVGFFKKVLSAKTEEEQKRYQNIARFFDKLKTFEAEHEDASVFAVVDWIDLSMQMGESPLAADIDWSNNNAVNILTVHSSKGLEFPIVFVVNLVTQRFPTRERREQIPIPQTLIKEILPVGDYHLQEERRLFYVATTRARDYLFLSAAHFYGDGKRERKISPFVHEALGEEAVASAMNKKHESTQLALLEWKKPDSDQPPTSHLPPPTSVTYLSYSQIQTFDICPLHYKLRYVLRIPTPQTAAQSFGTSMHNVLADFYQRLLRGEKVAPSDLPTLIEKNWISEGFSSKAHEKVTKKQAEAVLTNYIKNHFDPKQVAKGGITLELPFNFFLKQKESGTPLKVGGRIDRIDTIANGKIEIIDYKTGSNVPTEEKLKGDLQLTVYALAATEVNHSALRKKPEDILLSLHFLEADKKITTVRTKEQLEAAKELLFMKREAIAKSEFACSSSIICQNCEYKIMCSP